jgi:hypothetical protein
VLKGVESPLLMPSWHVTYYVTCISHEVPHRVTSYTSHVIVPKKNCSPEHLFSQITCNQCSSLTVTHNVPSSFRTTAMLLFSTL